METKTQRGEGRGRVLLCDNSRQSGQAAADQFPVCWVFVFQLDPVVCTYVIDHVYILSFDLLRILFAPDLPVRNYCISRGVYIYIYIYTYTHTHCRIRCGFLPFADFPVCASRSSPLPLPNHVTTHPYPAVPPPMPIKEQNNYT